MLGRRFGPCSPIRAGRSGTAFGPAEGGINDGAKAGSGQGHSSLSAASVVASDFGPVATGFHVAPLAAMILAVINKEPRTIPPVALDNPRLRLAEKAPWPKAGSKAQTLGRHSSYNRNQIESRSRQAMQQGRPWQPLVGRNRSVVMTRRWIRGKGRGASRWSISSNRLWGIPQE